MENINNCCDDVRCSPTSSRKKQRTKLLTPLLSNSKPNNKPPTTKITTPACTECGKTFWSWKALFGHMRCHPDRHWRGMNPPPNRRHPHPPRITTSGEYMEEDHLVASCLLMLANGRPNQYSPSAKCTTHVNQGSSICIADSAVRTNGEPNLNDQGIITSGGGEENKKIVASVGRHECSICLKVFSSGQALGGHKSRSHSHPENKITTSTCTRDNDDPAASGSTPVSTLDLNASPLLLVEKDHDNPSHNSSSLDLRLRL